MLRLDRPLASLDVETARPRGSRCKEPDPLEDRIVSFAVDVAWPDSEREIWSSYFNPGFEIAPESTAVHHITDEMVANAPRFADKAYVIRRGLEGKDLCGFNLRRYDLVVLAEEFGRCGLSLNLAGVRIVDAMNIYHKKFPRKLENLIEEVCGRKHTGAHGAQPDATGTLDGLEGLLRRFPDLDAMSLDDLAAYSLPEGCPPPADIQGKLYIDEDGDLCYAFGPHRDAKVRDEMGFAKWMLDPSRKFPPDTLKLVRAELSKIRGERRQREGSLLPT